MKTTDAAELYILLDGTHASAGDCAKGDDGTLRGPSGVPVAMTDEGEPMTVKRQAELGGNAMAAAMGKSDDGELLATTENQDAAARSAEDKPVHGLLAQAMMPAATQKLESKPVKPKAE